MSPRAASLGRTALAGCAWLALLGCEPDAVDCPDGWATDDQGRCLEVPTTSGLSVSVGDRLWEDVAELEAFCSEHNAVDGHVQIRVQHTEDLDALSCLRSVSGDLRLDDLTELQRLELPWLQGVGGSLYVQGNPVLEQLELPRLEEVGGALAVQYNRQLGQVELPRLRRTGEFLAIYSSGVRRVSLPALVQVGADEQRAADVLYIRVNPKLKEISAPEVSWVAGVLKISSNDSMLRMDLGSLEETGGGAYISFSQQFRELTLPLRRTDGFVYLQHSHLERFSLPCLEEVGGDLAVNFNERLANLHAPRLRDIGGVVNIQTNRDLPQDQVNDLVDQLDSFANTMVMGNGPDSGPRSAPPPCGLD